MIVLGIETATSVCSAGLAADQHFLAEFRLVRKYSHAEQLAEIVMHVCDSAQVSLKDLDAIAVSSGPGSFTGLRIGMGYAKGMAFGLDIPLIPVPTPDGIIQPMPPLTGTACVLLTARQSEAYRGIYHWKNDRWERVQDFDTVHEATVWNNLPGDSVMFVGEGVRQFKEKLSQDSRSRLINYDGFLPGGYAVAYVGSDRLKHGGCTDPNEAVPNYIKRFKGLT
jgi:tRNA threonylcarbamoyladenosine biosynthesis protein TsaB